MDPGAVGAIVAVDAAVVLLAVAIVALCITTVAMIVSAPPRAPRLGVPGRGRFGRSRRRADRARVAAPPATALPAGPRGATGRRAITGRPVRIDAPRPLPPAPDPVDPRDPARNRHLLSPETAAAEEYVERLVAADPVRVANLISAWMNEPDEEGSP